MLQIFKEIWGLKTISVLDRHGSQNKYITFMENSFTPI